MKLQDILEQLAEEVNKMAYQGEDKLVARVALPSRVVEALNKEFRPVERKGATVYGDIRAIHFKNGVVEIEKF